MITPLMNLLTSRIGKFLLAIVITLGTLWGVAEWGAGREREAAKIEQLETRIKTKEVVDNVQVSPTRTDAIERLRDNGWVR